MWNQLFLTWSANCFITAGASDNQVITDAKRDVSIITLSAQNNAKPLQQLKAGFKRTINGNFMVDGKSSFDQLVKNDERTYGNIQKVAASQEDD